MVVRKKSSKKVVKKKKVLKLKKRGKKVVKPYTLIKVSNVPDYELNKIVDGSKIYGHRYGEYEARFRRYFDWANNALFK